MKLSGLTGMRRPTRLTPPLNPCGGTKSDANRTTSCTKTRGQQCPTRPHPVWKGFFEALFSDWPACSPAHPKRKVEDQTPAQKRRGSNSRPGIKGQQSGAMKQQAIAETNVTHAMTNKSPRSKAQKTSGQGRQRAQSSRSGGQRQEREPKQENLIAIKTGEGDQVVVSLTKYRINQSARRRMMTTQQPKSQSSDAVPAASANTVSVSEDHAHRSGT